MYTTTQGDLLLLVCGYLAGAGTIGLAWCFFALRRRRFWFRFHVTPEQPRGPRIQPLEPWPRRPYDVGEFAPQNRMRPPGFRGSRI